MAMLKINGVDITTPSSFKVTITDLDSEKTQRNAKGELLRDRIAIKRNIDLEFPPLTQSEISTLLNAISATFFSCTYPDPQLGLTTTKTFYVSDRSAPMFNFARSLWESVSFSFVEK